MTWVPLSLAILLYVACSIWAASSSATKARWISRHAARVLGIRIASRLLMLNGLVVSGGASNRVYAAGQKIQLTPTNPAVPVNGGAILVGQLPGVAMTGPDGNGAVGADLTGVYKLTVYGVNAGGNVAVAIGDILYYDTATDHVSKLATGVRYGYALGTVTSGANAVIPVKVGY